MNAYSPRGDPQTHTNSILVIRRHIAKHYPIAKVGAHNLSRIHSHFCSIPYFCHLFTHPKTHTQTMAHCHHHPPPLSMCCVSDHVLRAVALPITIVAIVARSPPSFSVVAVGRHHPLCRRRHCHCPCHRHHRPLQRPPVCSLSPNSNTHSQRWWRWRQLGAGGGSLAAAKAVGRRRQQRSRSVSAAAGLLLWQR